MEKIIEISTGYPSMLRAVCESRASGTALDIVSMRNSVSVRRRVDEFRADRPSEEALCLSRLVDHPLLCANEPVQTQPVDLTATEQRLLDFFTGHPNQVCAKDALIQAVWPDEKVAAGLRDDSLAQLVHRLRDKLDSASKKHIQTIPGRGYRYTP